MTDKGNGWDTRGDYSPLRHSHTEAQLLSQIIYLVNFQCSG